MNTFYFPLKCKCGADATRFEAGDQDCGNLAAYEPTCSSCCNGDYRYCLKCLGHLDGHGEECKVGNCTCAGHRGVLKILWVTRSQLTESIGLP